MWDRGTLRREVLEAFVEAESQGGRWRGDFSGSALEGLPGRVRGSLIGGRCKHCFESARKGKRTCAGHAFNERAWHRDRWRKQTALGVCQCLKPVATGHTRCEGCLARARKITQERRAKARSAGVKVPKPIKPIRPPSIDIVPCMIVTSTCPLCGGVVETREGTDHIFHLGRCSTEWQNTRRGLDSTARVAMGIR